MASLVCRNIASLSRKAMPMVYARAYSDFPYIDPARGKVTSNNASMPDTLGHSVGPQRFELLAKAAGNEDPFEMSVKKRVGGTADNPTLIASMENSRLVGCVCEEDSLSINWMYLNQGENARCGCGYFFKLVPVEVTDIGQ